MEFFAATLGVSFIVLSVVGLVMYIYELLTTEYADSPYEDELHF